MNALADQKCFNHGEREAVGRCPECRNFYCRECITEHEGRIVCASCLGELASKKRKSSLRFTLTRPALVVVSCLFLWSIFFLFGRALLLLPDEFHEGTVWQDPDAISFDGGEN